MNPTQALALLAGLVAAPILATRATTPVPTKTFVSHEAIVSHKDPECFSVLDQALTSRALELAKLPATDAIALALKDQPQMRVTGVELKLRGSRPVFEVELDSKSAKRQPATSLVTRPATTLVLIDARDGRVLERKSAPAALEGAPAPRAWTFESDAPEKELAAWSFELTNAGKGQAVWALEGDKTSLTSSTTLSLKASHAGSTFNLALANGTSCKDVNVRARVRAQTGREDQGGGVLWRAQDADNYYVCRFNPLENNYRVYKVAAGHRTELASATVETEPGQWYVVRAQMTGDHITCYLDGKKWLDVHDKTFAKPGMIGLWTKADASSDFDDVAVQ